MITKTTRLVVTEKTPAIIATTTSPVGREAASPVGGETTSSHITETASAGGAETAPGGGFEFCAGLLVEIGFGIVFVGLHVHGFRACVRCVGCGTRSAGSERRGWRRRWGWRWRMNSRSRSSPSPSPRPGGGGMGYNWGGGGGVLGGRRGRWLGDGGLVGWRRSFGDFMFSSHVYMSRHGLVDVVAAVVVDGYGLEMSGVVAGCDAAESSSCLGIHVLYLQLVCRETGCC